MKTSNIGRVISPHSSWILPYHSEETTAAEIEIALHIAGKKQSVRDGWVL